MAVAQTRRPGTYILILRCDAPGRIQVGKWGVLQATPGYYAYVGSAFGPGGVSARVSRHCRDTKKMHWHIDYLREALQLDAVWYCQDSERREHDWAGVVSTLKGAEPVAGFGCTDCQCPSHLYHFARKPRLSDFRPKASVSVASGNCRDFG